MVALENQLVACYRGCREKSLVDDAKNDIVYTVGCGRQGEKGSRREEGEDIDEDLQTIVSYT